MKTRRNWLATALCALAMLATGSAFGAASTFTAVTDADDNGYTGTVSSSGDGYAFTAEDSARYYKFLNLYNDLLLDGEACAGCTNWHTVTVGGTWSSRPVTVTITNGARMVTWRNRNILFQGKGGMIVVSEPTARDLDWKNPVGNKITTVIHDTYPNMIGTVGYGSKFTLCSDVTSDTGTNDILRLLANGTASYHFVSNQNASVAARILFEGGEMWSLSEWSNKFQVSDGAKIVLQCVDGNPIKLRSYGTDHRLFSGPGTFETAGDGDFVLLQNSYSTNRKTVTLSTDEGGRFVWGHSGRFVLGGLCILEMGSDDVLPHGPQTGPVFIANGLASSETGPLVIDLNGTSNTVNGIAWIDDWHDGNWNYSRNHVVTNSSATVATLGLDVSSRTNLSEILNAKFAANAPTTINLRKVGAGTLAVNNAKAVATLATNACLQVAEGVVSFNVNATLVRPLSVDGGSIAVASGMTLNTSSIADADLSIGGLTVDASAASNPTITKFRPAANGTLYLTNVSGDLPAAYTVPINLTTVVDAENFGTWGVSVNGAPLKGASVVFENGALKVRSAIATVISFR
ncbi:MAG: hypothetical protein IJK04_05620 [Kiritimatiellae bacterium]|nr:hypothetical protein [Kiritimatiellia bacterium]